MNWTIKRLAPFTRAEDVCLKEQKVEYQGFMQLDTLTLQHRRFAGDFTPVITRELLRREPVAGALIWDPALAEVLLVEQFRVGAMADERTPWCLEVVAGIADEENESLEALIQREALEEANVTLIKLIPLPPYFVSPGGTNERVHLFLGLADLSQAGGVHGLASEHEDIRSHRVPTEQLPQLLAEGYLNNAASIIAVQWFLLHQTELLQKYS